MAYDHKALQEKFQRIWRDKKIYQPDLHTAQRPYYNLMMFPYPSAEGLHVGNMYAFTGADVHGRFRRMSGFDVFEPIGLDGFGIHSENFSIKIGKHPADQAKISQENFYRQLSLIGNGFAWENTLETYDPKYYRWTQWLFIEMFKHGLAYKANALVNWCPSCKTVLADEQVEDGKCERCKSVVERKEMSSWYLKITEYADRLLDNIDNYVWTDKEGKEHTGLKWPGKVTIAQKNWIGRSTGLEIDFTAQMPSGAQKKVTVWTKFWETIYGVTYLVLAPEHALALELATEEHKDKVSAYIEAARNKSEQDRKMGEKDKTGVFTGSYVINPVNGERVPVWVADYVLTGVGTGAVMGVPAHDERDFDFAKKYDLAIKQVVRYDDKEVNVQIAAGELSHEGEGLLMNSGAFDDQSAWGEGKSAMKEWMSQQGFARETTSYHLRDWLISRQRYWGPPIPLMYCDHCAKQGKGERAELPGWYADENLPVELPFIEDFKPQGQGTSPLDNASDEWKYVPCPSCGEQAVRETDVSDTFLDSSWYFLRYPSVESEQHPFPLAADGKWFPVDSYIGGAEHAVLHLLYSRFVTMALKDWKMLPFEEPFPYLFGHGLIIKDGAKMSKSKGNVVNPDEYIEKYGADALRTYLMFLGPYDQGGDFRDTGMHGTYRWLAKVWTAFGSYVPAKKSSSDVSRKLHWAIAENTKEMAQLKYNTCIARIMEVCNVWREGGELSLDDAVSLLKLLAPFAPYMTEEIHEQLCMTNGRTLQSIHVSGWPQADESFLQSDTVKLGVQVNGKVRATLEIAADQAADKAFVEQAARELPEMQKHLVGKTVKQVIIVPGRIVSFVVA
jgi:leucyl-tRNA synthetase